MEELIKVKNVSKDYGGTNVISNLSFTVGEGDSYGLLGPNGSGKTTLINLMTGQEKPSEGEILVDGISPVENPIEVKEKIGIVPEKESPFSFLTPREHFNFCAKVRGLPKEEVEEKIEYWSEKLSFKDNLDTLSKNLSRGNQQKVMFTQAVLHEPEILFIDEPIVNLDPIIQEKLKEIIINYNNEGKTIILSSHHLEFSLEICSLGLLLSNGQGSEINFSKKSKTDILEIFKGDYNEE